MDLQLMKKHIENVQPVFLPVLDTKDRSNISDFFCCDVVGNRRFAQNYGGYPRSEVAEINAQASLVEAQNLLRDLEVIPVNESNAGLSDAQIMLGHKSKYLQSASEMTYWLEDQLKIRDAQRAKAVPPTDGTIQFDNNKDSNTES